MSQYNTAKKSYLRRGTKANKNKGLDNKDNKDSGSYYSALYDIYPASLEADSAAGGGSGAGRRGLWTLREREWSQRGCGECQNFQAILINSILTNRS